MELQEKDYERIQSVAPSWVTRQELECLSRLARELAPGSNIMEIGSLYGGSTAVLALSNPDAEVIAVDEFSWTPEGYKEASAEQFVRNMQDLGIKNVGVNPVDSSKFFKEFIKWPEKAQQIDLLFIDGGHSFEYVYADINNFGKYAKIIALHDYDNPFWATVRQAVEEYMTENEGLYISEVVGQVVVLRRL